MIQLDYFIDSHCHLFTIADVPLMETIRHAKKELQHPLFMLLMPMLPFMSLEKYKPFINFFESEPEQNVKRLCRELKAALKTQQIEPDNIIITPLIMDFDMNGKVTKLDGQITRLVEAVKKQTAVKILPFLGIDPRKFVYDTNKPVFDKDTIRAKIDAFLSRYNMKSRDERTNPQNLKSGDIIGVKLYPPLGFKVYQTDEADRAAFNIVYEEFLLRDIPVTVHCQEDSFALTENHTETMLFTRADNWVKVFSVKPPDLSRLRINFGHFGGEKGVASTIKWKEEIGYDPTSCMEDGPNYIVDQRVNKGGWTYKLISLLKKHPNTYADISAYDFKNAQDAARLMWVLAFDRAGKFNDLGQHNLEDKLLWGSDYPMILDQKKYPNYSYYFSSFVKVINGDIEGLENHTSPDSRQLPPTNELLKKLVWYNPKKFLFE
jgi:hypothetical protein